jgi:hypothetical protein
MNPTQTGAAAQSSPLELKDLLEIHKTLAEEMRHTSNVVWQFSVAIVTLHGGAIAASATSGFENFIGRVVMVAAFFLSVWFSIMLLRQACERRGFRDRIWAVEAKLRSFDPDAFARIPRVFGWFTSIKLATILMLESLIGLAFFVTRFQGFLWGLPI